MAKKFLTAIRTTEGNLSFDYKSLENLPKSDSTLSKPNEFADAQAVGNKIRELNTQIKKINNQLENMPDNSHTHSATDITSGTLSSERLPIVPIEKGGTNAANGQDGLKNLLADGAMILSAHQYGETFPSGPVEGQIFFKKV